MIDPFKRASVFDQAMALRQMASSTDPGSPPSDLETHPDGSTANAYVIEVRGEAAGIVARDGQGFRFYACSQRFNHLEGTTFASPRDAELAALLVGRRTPRASGLQAFGQLG